MNFNDMKLTTENTERATPETDDQPTINAINDDGYAVPCVDIEFARKLERERDEARHDFEELAEVVRNLKVALMEVSKLTRTLKEERDEAREELRTAVQERHDFHWELQDAIRERNEARDQVKELIYISERAIALAEIDFENDKFGVVSELRDGLEKIQEGAK
jgi:hypothetical protein